MVVGNGLVASAFAKYLRQNSVVIFASGVSNSKMSSDTDFYREETLLLKTITDNPNGKLVYFSTTSIYDPDLCNTPYVLHKLKMEALVSQRAGEYVIFRLSNLAGLTKNQNTIVNFFYLHILHNLPFTLWVQSERNIIDVSDVQKIAGYILDHHLFNREIVNIANPINYPVMYIVECIEQFTGQKAIYREVEKGSSFHIDVSRIQNLMTGLHICFEPDYFPLLLKKYYSGKGN